MKAEGQMGEKADSLNSLISMPPERPAQGMSPLFGAGELGTARKVKVPRPTPASTHGPDVASEVPAVCYVV